MTAADRARRLAERAQAAQRAEAELALPPPPERVRPVRQTVDISPELHGEWSAWLLETALALGRRRVTTQDALAAAIAAIVDDEDATVARRVRRILEQDG